jgi:hypothetical protein
MNTWEGGLRARLTLMAISGALALSGLGAAPAGAASWQVTQIPEGDVDAIFFGVSCPTASLCVATGTNSTVATSTNPAGGAAAWKLAHLEAVFQNPNPGTIGMYPGNALRGVSCPTASFCVIAGPQGHLFTSTDPTGGATAWQLTDLGIEATHMNGVSCASPSLCVAVANNGKVIASNNPAAGAGAWSIAKLPGTFDLRGVSCPTAALCVAVGNEGNIFTSTDPAGGAGAWTLAGAPAGESSLNGISCPTASFCLTANAAQVVASVDPTGGLGAWSSFLAGTGLPVKGVSCPSPAACLAVDNNSDVLTSTDPTGGRGAWSFVNVIPAPDGRDETFNGMFAASCAGTALCVAAGTRRQLLISTDPFASGEKTREDGKRKGRRPRVTITWHPPKRIDPGRGGKRKVSFRFRADRPVARFRCKLDREIGDERHPGRYGSCGSPWHYRLKRGEYAFKVIAIGRDRHKSRPASFHFSVEFLREPGPAGTCPERLLAPLGRGCVTGR